jgi:lipopolysaccharide biosynthesis glycosyltransferase
MLSTAYRSKVIGNGRFAADQYVVSSIPIFDRLPPLPIWIATSLNNNRIALAVAFDERYIVAACTMLNSLARSLPAPDKLQVKALMPRSTSRSARQRLDSYARRRGLRLESLLTGEDFSMLPVTGPYTRAVYLSLLLPDLLPETHRILYLDVDLVVMRDVSELFDLDLGDRPLAAARDGFISESHGVLNPDQEPSGSPHGFPYFNAGVMVINAEMWRKERVGARAIDLLRESVPTPGYLEQDALNSLTAGRWTELDPRWNVLSISDQLGVSEPDRVIGGRTMAEQVRLERDAFILHFAGPRKPWDGDYPRTPNWDLYQRFAERRRNRPSSASRALDRAPELLQWAD